MMTGPRLSAALAAFVLLFATPSAARSACRDLTFENRGFTVCEAQARQDVRLFFADETGAVLGGFGRINAVLAPEGKELIFAMNAGMYHPDRSPVGLLITEGQQRARIITSEGPGNFGMLPNGVFCIRPGRFSVIESRRFEAKPPECTYATQSGPMLVIDGALHPRILPGSDSRYIRNGVGVSADGQTAFFVISGEAVNFDEFARLFRDELGTPNALYFDGKVSKLYSLELNRSDFGFQMGPMVGLVGGGTQESR
tara:strand:+ start:709 stop:1473 length:765 start_codon:yes stop_codon:yes gene_type:complete